MLTQSVPQDKRLVTTPKKRERLDKLNAREDSAAIREALTVPASVYLAQFDSCEVSQ
jgi:hypothetical protein